MASSQKMPLILILTCSLLLQGALGEVICDSLPADLCSFAVASSGKRCTLETYLSVGGSTGYTCTSSEVVVERFYGHIESDECVAACGVDRWSVGISSDAFLAGDFAGRLCSPTCYQSCPNIVDLYFNLAAGEGVHLPTLCKRQKSNPRRAMWEPFSSGGGVALSPVGSADYIIGAPASAPFAY
ncbi:NtEIG-E80 protein [Striga asiatica]|uniref:NtEIG-E80 protein n=1 Tax=Striga asiatica TaxID=4170 RepID=A0A5A7RAB5_STRAF|nr:NtEIG-E80 protein [Striga asiatica]